MSYGISFVLLDLFIYFFQKLPHVCLNFDMLKFHVGIQMKNRRTFPTGYGIFFALSD